jgi:hypothetical protein
MNNGGLSPGDKAVGSSSADFKNTWGYVSTPPIRIHGVVLS